MYPCLSGQLLPNCLTQILTPRESMPVYVLGKLLGITIVDGAMSFFMPNAGR
jgi:hypothetical protein